METGLKRKYTVSFLILLLTFILLDSPLILKVMFPVYYKEEIRSSSTNYRVDPYLVMAIIQIESKYRPDLVSKKGAVGLMQVMPDTAKWIIDQADFSSMAVEYLDEPNINIALGSWYVAYLNKEFTGNPYATIASYNAGPGNVKKWLDQGIWDGKKETINNIPFGETRHYLQRVLYYYDKYKKIYGADFTK